MKAKANRSNNCVGYEEHEVYEVLQLETFALRIRIRGESHVVARKDFDITQDKYDSPELIEKL